MTTLTKDREHSRFSVLCKNCKSIRVFPPNVSAMLCPICGEVLRREDYPDAKKK